MAAEKQQKPDANYYFVRDHKLRQNVKAKTETSHEEPGEGNKVFHFETYDMVTGRLRKIYVHEETSSSDPSKSWKVLNIGLLSSKGEYDWVQMYFSSREADSFLKRLPNIDLTKEITLKTMKTEDKKKAGKFHTMINVYQDVLTGVVNKDETTGEDIPETESKIVPYFWNKETPGKLPRLEEKEVQGKMIWDNSEVLKFYEKLVNVKNVEMPNVVRVTKGMNVDPAKLVFEENTDLGIKVCTGFEGVAFTVEENEENTHGK